MPSFSAKPKLTIKIAENRVASLGIEIEGRHRYEAVFLALLVQQGATSLKSGLTAAKLHHALTSLGQERALNRSQLLRLIDSVESTLSSLNVSRSTISHPARKRSIGPWWWAREASITINVIDGARLVAMLQAKPLPPLTFGFAKSGSLADTRALLWVCFNADAFAWDGAFTDVVDGLSDKEIWSLVTPEFSAQLHMRAARAQKTLRNFSVAAEHIKKTEQLCAKQPLLKALFEGRIAWLRARMRYNESPVENANAVYAETSALIAMLTGLEQSNTAGRRPALEANTLALSFNLRALAARRAIEALPNDTQNAQRMKAITACLDDCFSSLYFALTTLELELTQNIIANIAYILQRIAEKGLLSELAKDPAEEVFQWYRLAFAWHHRFHLADNTAWEYIFLGEYWLLDPERVRRGKKAIASKSAALGSAPRHPGQFVWHGHHPGEQNFYVHALARALEICDPRQIAYAALNLHRYSEIMDEAPLRANAIAALKTVKKKHPEVLVMMAQEGYTMPVLSNAD